jgi:hypothetical protein
VEDDESAERTQQLVALEQEMEVVPSVGEQASEEEAEIRIQVVHASEAEVVLEVMVEEMVVVWSLALEWAVVVEDVSAQK